MTPNLLRKHYDTWCKERKEYAETDCTPDGPSPTEWQDSDDYAVELLHAAMNHVIVGPEFDWSGEPDNDHRASMAMPFLLAFRRAYYHHLDENGEPTEPLGVVLTDFVCDLFHLADRVTAAEPDEPDEPIGGDRALRIAWDNYDEERQAEMMQIGSADA